MPPYRKWTTEENLYLMKSGYRLPWATIAHAVGRSETACKAQYKKIRNLRMKMGTWKGIR